MKSFKKKHHFSLVKKRYITFHPHSKRQNTLEENSNRLLEHTPECQKSTYERIPFINRWLICNKHNEIKNLSKYSSPHLVQEKVFHIPTPTKQTQAQCRKHPAPPAAFERASGPRYFHGCEFSTLYQGCGRLSWASLSEGGGSLCRWVWGGHSFFGGLMRCGYEWSMAMARPWDMFFFLRFFL